MLQQECSGRPDLDGNLIGVGDDAAPATNGNLMSRGRFEHRDNLLLIAATTIVILTAQRYFQISTPLDSAPIAGSHKGRPVRPSDRSTARADTPPTPCRSRGLAGRTSCGAPTSAPAKTACSPPPPAWCSSACSRYFRPITALVSSYGLFADPSTIGANLQTLALMLPEGSFQIVQDQIARVLSKGNTALGATFLFGLALAIWSANAGIKAVIDA